jgi:hypothetical protein
MAVTTQPIAMGAKPMVYKLSIGNTPRTSSKPPPIRKRKASVEIENEPTTKKPKLPPTSNNNPSNATNNPPRTHREPPRKSKDLFKKISKTLQEKAKDDPLYETFESVFLGVAQKEDNLTLWRTNDLNEIAIRGMLKLHESGKEKVFDDLYKLFEFNIGQQFCFVPLLKLVFNQQ